MANPTRNLAPIELPCTLIFTTALTCGVLAALALQIYLSRAGYDLLSFRQNPMSAKALAPWWAVPVAALFASGATAAALSQLPLPWRRFRLLRWTIGAVLVLALAHLGHAAAGAPEAAAGATVAARLGALALATVTAMVGAYFTVRR